MNWFYAHPHGTAYYNDVDPGACAWLRELMQAGLIAPGVIDNRSLLEVKPDDVRDFVQCHFFAGIGGWSLALRLAGWPDNRPVWTGSPPCQPFSVAGEGLSRDDPRHLAPHFVWLVGAVRPGVLFGEQVASAAVFGKAAKRARGNAAEAPDWAWLDDVSDRLEAARYAVGAVDFPSAGVGAPHIRQRTYFAGLAHEWLADVERNGQHWSRDERAGWRDEPADRSAAGGLVNSVGAGLEGQPRHGDGSGEPGRLDAQSYGSTGAAGHAGGLADCNGRNASAEGLQRGGQHGQQQEDGGASGGLPEPNGRERHGVAKHGEHDADRTARGWQQGNGEPARHRKADRPAPLHGFWADADWLGCRDGKWRPVEPGTFPLAHGVSGRVGLLRGYGNAINPQQAAIFIESVVEAIAGRERVRVTEEAFG